MRISKIEELEKFEIEITTFKKNTVNRKHLSDFLSIINHFDVTVRHKLKSRFSYIVVDLLKKFDARNIVEGDDKIDIIVEIVELIGVMIDDIGDETDSSDAIIYFLHTLRNKDFSIISTNLYNKLIDTISEIKWIFKLTKNNENIFPIHEIIYKIVEEFEYSSENLLYLTMALQIFVDVESKSEDVENRFRELSSKYKIGILDCIMDGGKLFENSDQNYKFNSTIIAKNDKYIIIRNKSKKYFEKFGIEIHSEVNEHNEEMCYFVKISIETNWKFIDFEEYMFMASPKDKISFLLHVMNENTYNFFFMNSIIIDSADNKFIRLVNLSDGDGRICINGKNFENNYKSFYEIIVNNNIKNVRASILFGHNKDCDNVTLDFLLAFIKYLKIDIHKCDLFQKSIESNGLVYQNSIIKNYFDCVMHRVNIITFCDIYEDYYKFIYDHFNFNINSTINDVSHIVYPFTPYQPFKSESEIIKWIYSKEEYKENYIIEEITITKDKKGYHVISKQDKEDVDYEFQDYDFEINQTGDVYVLINHNDKEIVFDERINWLFASFKKMKLDFSNFIFDADKKLINQKLKCIIKLIKGTNIDYNNYKKFNLYRDDCKEIICLFKLLWHFAINEISLKKIERFYKLIFEYHHTDSILMENDWSDFFMLISDLDSDDGTLILAKESSGDSGTLYFKYNEYHQANFPSERAKLSRLFDASMLQKDIKASFDGLYTYKGHVIKKIIFVTDNITHGTAANQLLKFHLTGEKVDSRKKYIELQSEKNIKSIIEKNNIHNDCILIYSLYCLETTKLQPIQDREYKIVSSKKIESKYVSNEKVLELYESIYGEASKLKCGFVCMIRCNNMPNKTLFNENTLKTLKLVGIFNRKKEL